MSSGLKCQFVEYRRDVWYYLIEDDFTDAADWRSNATAYGPFPSESAAHRDLEQTHQNPGAFESDIRVGEPVLKSVEVAIGENRQGDFDQKALIVEYAPRKWYVVVEPLRHADELPPADWREGASAYGPFASEDAAREALDTIEPANVVWAVAPLAALVPDPLLDELIATAVDAGEAIEADGE
jgi:hypothetical protein